jgi:8-oxo-dGTP pyrophosphatase MutT (NUDIX family)
VGSVLRELEEETGLSCDRNEIKSLGFVTPDAGILAARVHIHAALRCMRTKPYIPIEFGHQEFRIFSRDDIESLIARSEIQDPCILIARYKFVQTKGLL